MLWLLTHCITHCITIPLMQELGAQVKASKLGSLLTGLKTGNNSAAAGPNGSSRFSNPPGPQSASSPRSSVLTPSTSVGNAAAIPDNWGSPYSVQVSDPIKFFFGEEKIPHTRYRIVTSVCSFEQYHFFDERAKYMKC
jgi:hypothetical protein